MDVAHSLWKQRNRRCDFEKEFQTFRQKLNSKIICGAQGMRECNYATDFGKIAANISASNNTIESPETT